MAGPSVWNSLPDSLRDPAVQTLAENVFVCDVLRHAAQSGFYENALYKFTFTYLLTYKTDFLLLLLFNFSSETGLVLRPTVSDHITAIYNCPS